MQITVLWFLLVPSKGNTVAATRMVVGSERYSRKQVPRKNGGDDETRTRDLCRDSAAL
jgi:hypothetical protein